MTEILKQFKHLPIADAYRMSREFLEAKAEKKAKRIENKDFKELKEMLQKGMRNGEDGLISLCVTKENGHIKIDEVHIED